MNLIKPSSALLAAALLSLTLMHGAGSPARSAPAAAPAAAPTASAPASGSGYPAPEGEIEPLPPQF
jgi:hypothetical protein